WYNVQFYCGWGDVSTPSHYDEIMRAGWSAERIVMGVVTNSGNGAGWVESRVLGSTVKQLSTRYPTFGGISGWEWFNSVGEDGVQEPEKWGEMVGKVFYPD